MNIRPYYGASGKLSAIVYDAPGLGLARIVADGGGCDRAQLGCNGSLAANFITDWTD